MHDYIHAIDVQAAGGDVCANQHGGLAVHKCLERPLPFRLGEVAVDSAGFNAQVL